MTQNGIYHTWVGNICQVCSYEVFKDGHPICDAKIEDQKDGASQIDFKYTTSNPTFVGFDVFRMMGRFTA